MTGKNFFYGVKASFIEPAINREASQYMEQHYEELVLQARKMGLNEEKAFDAVHDVYVSIVKAEKEGNGYNVNNGKTGDFILVHQFIFGRLKKYSKNDKYRTDIVQRLKGSNRETAEGEVIASSGSATDNFDSLDSFQKAYASAGTYDDLAIIEDELSIKEQIEFCEEFDSVVGMKMRELFKNLNILRNENVDKSLFNSLKAAVKYHTEFGEAFQNIVQFSMEHADIYNSIVSTL